MLDDLWIWQKVVACVCVLQVNGSEMQLTFLHPSGPSKLFMCSLLDILWVPASKMDSETEIYAMSEKEPCCTNEKL
jgi:hypothetical protein